MTQRNQAISRAANPTATSIVEELAELWDSGACLIEMITVDETRALEIGQRFAHKVGAGFTYWSLHRGLDPIAPEARDPIHALDAIARHKGPLVVAMLDFHHSLQTHEVERRLRDMLPWLAANDRCLLLVSPKSGLSLAISQEAARVDVGPPVVEELSELLSDLLREMNITHPLAVEVRDRLVLAVAGLGRTQARRAFARALARDPTGSAEALSVLVHEKKRMFAQDLGVEFIDDPEPLDALGGLDGFKSWLVERRASMSQEAQRFGLKPPRGVLLLGVQGCGKSLSAKCAATYLGLPLVRLDLPRVMGSSGEGPSAEESLRRALVAVELSAPVALWVDEIEKAFAGSGKGADARASRVLGAFSTWLQERQKPVFVVATANDVSQLPPELLRRGRFDELFFVDLPDLEARENILALHLRRRGRVVTPEALRAVAEQCSHYSGAELEQVVVSALHRAFAQKRELTEADLRRAAREMIPLYKTYEESVKQLREWSRGRARSAGREGAIVDLFRRRGDTLGDGEPSGPLTR
jgi:hypothetical protein